MKKSSKINLTRNELRKNKEFNLETLQFICNNFYICELTDGNKSVTTLVPSKPNLTLIANGETEERKELFGNLLVNAFGTGNLEMVKATFSLFESSLVKYNPDFSFVNEEGFDIVKSAISGGNVDIFKLACDIVGIDNIRDKPLALSFATEKKASHIEEVLKKEEQDKILESQQKEAEERAKRAIKNRNRRNKEKARKAEKNADPNKKDESEPEILLPEETSNNHVFKTVYDEEPDIIKIPEKEEQNNIQENKLKEAEERAKKVAIKKEKKEARRKERKSTMAVNLDEQNKLEPEIVSQNETENSENEIQETFLEKNYDDLDIDQCLEEFKLIPPDEYIENDLENYSPKLIEKPSENERIELETSNTDAVYVAAQNYEIQSKSHKSNKEKSDSFNIEDVGKESTWNISAKEFIPQTHSFKIPSGAIYRHEKEPLDDKNKSKGRVGNSYNS